MGDSPWWWPEKADETWISRLRNDYPEETANMDDDEVSEHYNDWGGKYVDTWDHLGDARASWEKLADAFFKQRAALEAAQDYIGSGSSDGRDELMTMINEALEVK